MPAVKSGGVRKPLFFYGWVIVGVNYKDCSATWRKLKQEILSDELKRRDFIARLREAVR